MEAVASLNVFQRLVRTWEEVHPYNAAQVVTLKSAVTSHDAQRAWYQVLESMGLGRVRVDSRQFIYEALNGEATRYPLRALPADVDLSAYLSSELNRPFDDPDEPPFRPFLIADRNRSTFGVVYRHWVADSVSIRGVLQRWHDAIANRPPADTPPGMVASGYWKLFGRGRGDLHIDRTVLALFRSHMRFRQVLKVQSARGEDYAVRVLLGSKLVVSAQKLCAYARRQDTTVGNVLLAALAEAAAKHIPFQHRPNRCNVAVGNIVDLRPHAHHDVSDAFGLLLGFTHIVCRPTDIADWQRLLRVVTLQNRAGRHVVAQDSGAWMLAALTTQKLVPPERLYRFYRKELPLAAGLSNVNLGPHWPAEDHPLPADDYLRVSPTGPMAPAVLSATTLGKQMKLALTYRIALLTDDRAQAILRSVSTRVMELAAGHSSN